MELALSSPPPLAGKTVAVVGGGVGGLVAAGLLARQGAAVTVLEQRPVAGGRLGEHRLGPAGEWRFDSGPSLLLMPEVYRETFELLGDPEPLEMSPVAAPFYHVFFGDDPAGTAPIQLDPARRREEFAAAIERLEGWPGDSMERFDAYMAAATAALDGGWPLAIEERWDVKTVTAVLPAFARSALRNFPANLPVGASRGGGSPPLRSASLYAARPVDRPIAHAAAPPLLPNLGQGPRPALLPRPVRQLELKLDSFQDLCGS